ncbi:type VI secretion system baseplate subunit TssE [Pseudomonas helleri]|uniref:type VI secretion system baseplate subunit TssE n=1 Tax=Pseudomonas helleri TaxID=1608996 RepID=UPI003F9BD3BD
MSAYGSLFERLAGDVDKRRGLSPVACAQASVAAHLAKMLSTRAGSVQTLPDYGLPDLNNMRLSLHDALTQAREAIEIFIERYEPRLSQVRVSALPRDGWLDVAGTKRQVSFTAHLDGSGQVRVGT